MENEERLSKVRAFLNREDLEGTDLNLKNQCVELDKKISAARADFQQVGQQLEELQRTSNNMQLEILSLSQRLEGLCDLIVSLSSEEESADDEDQE